MELAPTVAENYIRDVFGQIVGVAEKLGDAFVNERPPGPATNSVAALVTHCCGVTEYWLGHVAIGRPSHRDRDAEFRARATVAELRALVERTVDQAAADVAALAAGHGTDPAARDDHLEMGDMSDATVVVHVLEELYQHVGQMEVTADVLLH